MPFLLLVSRFGLLAPCLPATRRLERPWCAGRDRVHRIGQHMGATQAMREYSQAGTWQRGMPHPGACRCHSRAAAFIFLLLVPLVAQGLVWSPALAATCEIPAAVASSHGRVP